MILSSVKFGPCMIRSSQPSLFSSVRSRRHPIPLTFGPVLSPSGSGSIARCIQLPASSSRRFPDPSGRRSPNPSGFWIHPVAGCRLCAVADSVQFPIAGSARSLVVGSLHTLVPSSCCLHPVFSTIIDRFEFLHRPV